MIDIFTIKPGDWVEYRPYRRSEDLENIRHLGTYQDFMIWSPDRQQPVEMWLELIRENGLPTMIRASQVTNVYRATSAREEDDYEF